MTELLLIDANRQCLKTLFKEHTSFCELLNAVKPIHLGNNFVFACATECDAQQLYQGLLKYSDRLAQILRLPMIIMHKTDVLHILNAKSSLQLIDKFTDNAMPASTVLEPAEIAVTSRITATWAVFLEDLSLVTGSSPESLQAEILELELNQSAMTALTQLLFAKRLRRPRTQLEAPITEVSAIAEPETTPVELEVEEKSDTENLSPKEILKAQKLPLGINSLKQIVPKKPPGRINEATLAKEQEEIKLFIKQGLAILNENGKKHFSILENIANQTEAGKIYLQAFVDTYKPVDIKPKQSSERPNKIMVAVAALLAENYADKS